MESERKRGADGRFEGLRVNVEDVPRLPTFPARWVLEDPRRRPYFVYWAPENGPAWALKMASAGQDGGVLVTFENGQTQLISVLLRRMPKGAGSSLVYLCPSCESPSRYLYRLALLGTKLVTAKGLVCQRCAKLRFASQGWYKPAFARGLGPRGRNPWEPRAVSDPRIIAEDIAPIR